MKNYKRNACDGRRKWRGDRKLDLRYRNPTDVIEKTEKENRVLRSKMSALYLKQKFNGVTFLKSLSCSYFHASAT